MNELIKSMSADMGISPYSSESENSFIYRVLFSGLGQWCLRISAGSQNGISGTTKHNQTLILNNLISKYIELFPGMEESLRSDDTQLSVLIRHIYQEVGYLFTDDDNRNHLCDIRRVVDTGNSKLCLHSLQKGEINGLGVFNPEATPSISWREFLIRDSLTPEQYINSKYDTLEDVHTVVGAIDIAPDEVKEQLEEYVLHDQLDTKEELFSTLRELKEANAQAKSKNPTLFLQGKYSPHSFRHSIAVHMLECGESLVVIKAFLGHESINTTTIYTSVTPELANKYLRERGKVFEKIDTEPLLQT